MSHVYRAVDTVIGRPVAVKILTDSGSQDPEAKARFLTEARTAGNVTHENIISVYDFGERRPARVVHGDGVSAGRRPAQRHPNGHTGDLERN